MDIQKIIGLFIISIGLLVSALSIQLAQLTMYTDQLSNDFWTEYTKYLPLIVCLLISIAIIIGIFLVIKNSKN
ncbi:hypothetical protein [Clostridium ganghwense]|uniref:Uncharacterized protein n=1 Tax=Clostridium ganghwense TaxID=312089 RepID=A0ABT4CV24_9CLOT|nr:hypothetical protein [Clostridium ganghwense]MCY6372298.1 hypothetical protein [Clostridium ganghwense]